MCRAKSMNYSWQSLHSWSWMIDTSSFAFFHYLYQHTLDTSQISISTAPVVVQLITTFWLNHSNTLPASAVACRPNSSSTVLPYQDANDFTAQQNVKSKILSGKPPPDAVSASCFTPCSALPVGLLDSSSTSSRFTLQSPS